MVACSKCGQTHNLLETCEEKEVEYESPVDKVLNSIPWWAKAGAGAAVGIAVAGSLPAQVTTLAASGVLIGGTWIVMVLMPLGEYEKDWLARHPRTFMLLHVPMTVAVAKLGEGLLMAFGNLAGGVIATLYLLRWGHKRGIRIDGTKTDKYVPPKPNGTSHLVAKTQSKLINAATWALIKT